MPTIPISEEPEKLTGAKKHKKGKTLATRSWGNEYKRHCYAKDLCLDLRKKYAQRYDYHLYPVCPVLKEVVNREPPYRLPQSVDTCPTLNSMKRILLASAALARLEPKIGVIVWCAHNVNLLKDWIDPIRNDLKVLPKCLEKDFPDTSKKCAELIAELELAELSYSMHCNRFVYLLPGDPSEVGKYANWASFLDWRERQSHLAGPLGSLEQIEINRFTHTYPAEAVRIALKLCEELAPLVRILSETATEKQGAEKREETEQKATPDKWRRLWNWLRNHPHSYGLQGGIIFLIAFLIVGFLMPQWKQWCWGVAGLAFLVLILSLLGGRSSQ